MQRHGYKGAFEMAATVDYLFGYDATAQRRRGLDVRAGHRRPTSPTPRCGSSSSASNPWALRSIAERLLEAAERGHVGRVRRRARPPARRACSRPRAGRSDAVSRRRFPFSAGRRAGRRQAGAAPGRRRPAPRRRAAPRREGLGQDDAGPRASPRCCPATRRSSSCRSAPPRTGWSARSTSPPRCSAGERAVPARPAGRRRTAACSTSTRSTCWPTTSSTCCSTSPSSGVNRVERDGIVARATPPASCWSGR